MAATGGNTAGDNVSLWQVTRFAQVPRNMSDSLCDAVDICLTGVHNMHLRILHGRGVFGRRPSMRRAIPGIAVLAAGLLYLTGCTPGGAPARGPAPPADGIRPITLALRKGNPRWPPGGVPRREHRPPPPKGHPPPPPLVGH